MTLRVVSKHYSSVILFANTRWFVCNFKSPLISYLCQAYPDKKIYVIYLRNGPVVSPETLQYLKSLNVVFCRLGSFLVARLRSFSIPFNRSILLVYTIGPILLSGIFLKILSRNKFLACATLEGLGRLFLQRVFIHVC